MRNGLLRALMVMSMVLASGAAVASPASASEDPTGVICVLNQDTWLRASEHGAVLRTLTAGRGFRSHGIGSDTGSGIMWIYGHGAEAPWQDGWVPQSNLSGCYRP